MIKKKKAKAGEGMVVVVLGGKERIEDNTEALRAGMAAAWVKAEGLKLVLRGEGVLGPFPVLELCDRLQELKVAGKRVVTVAQSWLGAPDLLLWLQGTERFLTASGYGHVKVPAWSKYSSYVAEKAAVEHPDGFWGDFLEPEEAPQMRQRLDDPCNYAYEKVLERLNEFFPVPEYVNKVLPREHLADLGLITGEGLDRVLMEEYKNAVSEKPTTPGKKRELGGDC